MAVQAEAILLQRQSKLDANARQVRSLPGARDCLSGRAAVPESQRAVRRVPDPSSRRCGGVGSARNDLPMADRNTCRQLYGVVSINRR